MDITMTIVSIFFIYFVGKLTHKDSMGTEETLGKGAVQFMVISLC